MKKTVLFLLVCLIGGNAIAQVKTAGAKSPGAKVVEQQTKVKDIIIVEGVEYYRVKTLDDLKQIGFAVTKDKNNEMVATSKNHRTVGGCCQFNHGTCGCKIRVNDNNITAADYIEETGKDGKIIKTLDNRLPYYSSKTKHVYFQ